MATNSQRHRLKSGPKATAASKPRISGGPKPAAADKPRGKRCKRLRNQRKLC